MTGRDPDPPNPLEAALGRSLDFDDGLLLGVDFDGTLAPIVEEPTDAAITDRARAALEELSEHPHVAVAVVSGRELSDLAERVGVDGVVYAGNHGLELREGDSTNVHPLAVDQRREIDVLCERLEERLDGIEGAEVEDKGVTATVHFRKADDAERVARLTEGVVSEAEAELHVSTGKCVREIRPAVDWDKGAAMRLLVERSPAGYRPLYVGDDTTDEDAFRALRPEGIGIRVGSATGSDTDAAYQLPDQEAVPELLERLLECVERRFPARSTDDAPVVDDVTLLERPFDSEALAERSSGDR